MERPNKFAAYSKIKVVINSCLNKTHLQGSLNMLMNFYKMYNVKDKPSTYEHKLYVELFQLYIRRANELRWTT